MRTLLKLLLLNLFLCGVCYAPPLKPFRGAVLPHGRLSSRGLVAAYFFNEGSGNKVSDLSGNGYTGTFQGTALSWTAGKFGSALNFPGTDEFVNVDNFEIVYPFTMVAWAKTNQLTSAEIIVSIADKDDTDYHAIGFGGDRGGDPVLAWTFDKSTSLTAESSVGYSADTWHQIVGVFANASSRKVYLDGGNEGTNTLTHTVSDIDRVRIGVSADSTPFGYITAQVDHVLIYNRALPASEIASLYRDSFRMSRIYWNWGVFGTISVVTDVYSGRGIGRGVGRGLVR